MKDHLLQEYTQEELAIEFLMDRIEEDPKNAYPQLKDGEVVKVQTGDTWFDSIDDKIANGEELKLTDIVAPEHAGLLKSMLRVVPKEKKPAEEPVVVESFSDSYLEE